VATESELEDVRVETSLDGKNNGATPTGKEEVEPESN